MAKARKETVAETAARRAVLDAAQAMSRTGLSPGRSGNVSMRWRDGLLITPSGMAYADMTAADIVAVDPEGRAEAGQRVPSSELPFHRAIYGARVDIGAIAHTHSLHATVLACAGKPIPAFHYMVAAAGGVDIPCVPYALFGTEALSVLAVGGLKSRNACLLAHHGAIAVGGTCALALELAHDVEVLSEQYIKLLTLGPPRLLTSAQMADVLERFKRYGQAAQPSTSF
jgi:L-fuculose-phosphate aldolase